MKIELQRYRNWLAAIALFSIPISGLSIDIYVPSLPAVSQYFGVEKSLAQLSITFYMIGLGFMQLFAGSLSDTFGRRKPFLISTFIYFVVSLLIPFSYNIYFLLLMRLIQGLAVATAVVPMRSVITDLFEGKELYKMFNYMTMVWSLGPIVAPAIGGYLQHFFGWQSNFYFLAAYSLCCFLVTYFYLPETSSHYLTFHPIDILKRYKTILFHWHYFWGVINNGVLYCSLIIFGVIAPFLFQHGFHFNAIEFGHVALLMGIAWFLGNMTNRFLINIALKTKTFVCYSAMLIIAVIMMALTFLNPNQPLFIIIPLMAFLWLGGIVFPNYFARSLSFFKTATGSANSLLGAFVFFIGGFGSAIGASLQSTNAVTFAALYIGIVLLLLAVSVIDKSKSDSSS